MSVMRPSAGLAPSITGKMVRAGLTRVLGSSIFATSQRLSQFLKFVVERANEGKRARQYEPDPVAHDLYLKGRYAQSRLIGGSVEQAIGFFEQVIAGDPNYAGAYEGLAEGGGGSHGLMAAVAAMGRIHASAGNVDRAQQVLRQLLEARNERYIPATDIAAIHSALGDRKRTLEWLGHALEEQSMHLFFVWLGPRWRWLHGGAGFQALARRLSLRQPAR
jgi:tetratricopeptide (TPR) repeat protein